ncbi:MAG: hypothetical protein UT86_C0004G0082 [Candidatus Magasanikbacteria bacterium GW2011_GWC2_40_17]|uniref:Uncharacterized protein n=1 Tax=Candidatus Magasanikbacteria bacterium GW2011_GWA2_42_32 TaxID=1619039 RepID=A0A0G1A7X8_9BACT|nr:MAG: hypothetical protein UT86_C0004G0082 [Candidatus Magasanikbacteria bacterium GW2011_GWC2_40_17]KKS57140.1 MAG: hypothetical protein UV20_C0003G0082 [Candidatus Magasanikbacteria bacterium GW2011_GWA2_42_32]OGH85339.1 MAG: hypothetical protein A2294_01035 [Candidatus Magasanikbacteria bacterium RIFOXYB2_FULL_38_10]
MEGKIYKGILVAFLGVIILALPFKALAQTGTEPIVCDLKQLKDDKGIPLYSSGNPSWFFPDCVYFEGTSKEKTCGCRNINVFLQLLVNVVNVAFEVVGGVALLFFIYGGFVILTAAGGERVKKGKETLVAAAIGLVIIFSAQLLLSFILDTVIKAGGSTSVSLPTGSINVEIK